MAVSLILTTWSSWEFMSLISHTFLANERPVLCLCVAGCHYDNLQDEGWQHMTDQLKQLKINIMLQSRNSYDINFMVYVYQLNK